MTVLSDYSSIVTAGVAVTGLLSSGFAALWGRLEYTNRKTRDALSEAQKTLKKCERREAVQREEGVSRLTIIELFCQAMEQLSPGSMLVKRARRHLDAVHMDILSESYRIGQEDDE
jgi:hypothetical protein